VQTVLQQAEALSAQWQPGQPRFLMAGE